MVHQRSSCSNIGISFGCLSVLFLILFMYYMQTFIFDPFVRSDMFRLGQVVYAKTDITAGSKGITAFIIEKGMPGYVDLVLILICSI